MAVPSFVPVCYAAGDIFLSASTSETQGLTYLEALAAGRPAVCRADPCLQDVIVDGVNGWQYRTPEELERHVRALLADEPARRAMGRCAAATAARFSDQAFALQAAALYRRAIIQKQAAARRRKGAGRMERMRGGGMKWMQTLRALAAGLARNPGQLVSALGFGLCVAPGCGCGAPGCCPPARRCRSS